MKNNNHDSFAHPEKSLSSRKGFRQLRFSLDRANPFPEFRSTISLVNVCA